MAVKTSFIQTTLQNANFDEIADQDAQAEAELNQQYEAYCQQQDAKAQADAEQFLEEWTVDTTPDAPPLVSSTPVAHAIQQIEAEEKPPYIPHAYSPRVNDGGNFCAHYPKKPRFVLIKNPYDTDEKTDELGHKRHSAILYDIVARLRAYYDDPSSILSFNAANSDKRKSTRQRNSSRREAIINLSIVMVMSMDLITLRVGYPSKKGFISRPMKWLAEKANLSFSRTKRAMSDLNHSGVLSSFQRRELIDAESKTFKFHTAARAFSSAFFAALGVNLKRLGATRKWAGENAERKNLTKQKSAAEQALIMNRIGNHFGRDAKKSNGQCDEEDKAKKQRHAKRRTEITIEVMQANPELKQDPQALRDTIEQQLSLEGLIATPV